MSAFYTFHIHRALQDIRKGKLNISGIGLSYLPITIPDTVTTLILDGNEFTELPSIPPTVLYISFENNKLTSLPPLHDSVLSINFRNNRLTSLPPLPASLQYLDVGKNRLESLPPLPSQLQHLDCGENSLSSLPPLPKNLRFLGCMRNQITALPVTLPNKLHTLSCDLNELQTLPFLPMSLKWMQCSGNPFREPFRTFVEQYLTMTTNPTELRKYVNSYLELKPGIIAARYNPEKIFTDFIRNKNEINMNAPLSEANYEKFYERRGEVWTEGVGKAVGGKRKSRRKTHKKKKQ